ncbi:MAG TPA: hypothetical protein VFS44_11295 [Gemmatimonadaceae bacterium]|nr:hypothetical protein [Gemmatimonadaceae bacterium]
MRNDLHDDRLRYGGWVTFGWRSARVMFPDFPELDARARCGAGFDDAIRAQLARHMSELIESGAPLPSPSIVLGRDGRPVRWYTVRRPG